MNLRQLRVKTDGNVYESGARHQVEALKATDEAIRKLEICLKYDKD